MNLCSFILYKSNEGISESVLNGLINAISFFHDLLKYPNPVNDPLFMDIKKFALKNTIHVNNEKYPLSPSIIKSVFSTIDVNNCLLLIL